MGITSLPHSAVIKRVLFPFGIDSGHLGKIIENKKDFPLRLQKILKD